MKYTITTLREGDLDEALALVRDVFMAFEAPDYTPEGVEEFMRYIEAKNIRNLMQSGELQLWCCHAQGKIVGVSACRGWHISLLFVAGAHHRRGIARQLLEAMLAHCRSLGPGGTFTVNASPYGLAAYRRLGFVATGHEQTVNGIRFIPMKRPPLASGPAIG